MNKNSIDIIYSYISDNLEKYDFYRSLLNDEEKIRADRFYFGKDRNCFTIARALLKIFLSEYLNVNPGQINFIYNQYGKPLIDYDLKFNISHSADIIIFAFTLKNEIGIDIEFMKKNIKYKELIKRFFSKKEIEDFLSLDEKYQKAAFFNGWSRKEAYIKAIGKGLSIPLDSFDVSIKPEEPAKIFSINNQTNHHWNLMDSDIDKNYKSAFAIEAEIGEVDIKQYKPENV